MPNTNKSLSFKSLRVGLFVFAGLAILGFLVLNSTGNFNPFEKKFKLKTTYTTADGLREGAEVQLAGVNIGKVEKVKLLPPDEAGVSKIEATMSVNSEIDGQPIYERIRTDSIAQLASLSLLANDKLINISPGTQKGTAVGENYVLPSASAKSLNQLADSGNELVQQINKIAEPTAEIMNKANRGEGTLGRVLNDQQLYNNLDSTVSEAKVTMLRLQTTIDKVNNGQGSAGKLLNDPALYDSLNRTVTGLEEISKDLRAGKGTAGKFLYDDGLYNDSRQAIQDIRNTLVRIDSVIQDLNAGKGTAGKLLKDEQLYDEARNTLAKFNTTATKLETILGDAQAGKGTLGKILVDETLYNNLNQTTANVNQITTEGTKLLYDFRQNPKKYLSIKLSLF